MLLKAIVDEPVKPAIMLGLFYGLRRSEALGLRWKDVNFNNDTILICNTVVRTKTVVEQEQTKSDASNRTLFIIPETRDYLLNIKKQQDENRLLLGSSYHDNDHVCTWDDGQKFKPNYLSQRLTKILRNNKLPHIRFHDLRHTAGSLLLSKGVSVKQIQEYLGHERVSTTLDIYGHLTVEGKREASLIMGNLLENVS
jgi:integrase